MSERASEPLNATELILRCTHGRWVGDHWLGACVHCIDAALDARDTRLAQMVASEADVARQLVEVADENVRLERRLAVVVGYLNAANTSLDAALKMLTQAQLDARGKDAERIDLRIQVREQQDRIAALESALHRHHACGGEPRDCGICAAWVPEGRKSDGG